MKIKAFVIPTGLNDFLSGKTRCIYALDRREHHYSIEIEINPNDYRYKIDVSELFIIITKR